MINFFKKLFGGGIDLAEVIGRNATIVDVRTPEEFKNGHLPGSINIPLAMLDGKIKELKDSAVPIISCCASGMRSGIATKQLKKQGIEAYNGGPWQRVQRYL